MQILNEKMNVSCGSGLRLFVMLIHHSVRNAARSVRSILVALQMCLWSQGQGQTMNLSRKI